MKEEISIEMINKTSSKCTNPHPPQLLEHCKVIVEMSYSVKKHTPMENVDGIFTCGGVEDIPA